eukprot:10512378-Prorocentrum_lima.AAC.1
MYQKRVDTSNNHYFYNEIGVIMLFVNKRGNEVAMYLVMDGNRYKLKVFFFRVACSFHVLHQGRGQSFKHTLTRD